MSYLGAAPVVQGTTFSGIQSESFNGNSSTAIFTLSRSVSFAKDIEVVVNNVQQSPYDGSYSVNGTTLTFSEAPSTGTNNIYVIYRDAPIGSITDTLAVKRAGDTMTGNLDVPSLNEGQLAGFRNKIINGKMDIAQRGTNFAGHVAGFTLDRYACNVGSTGAVTFSQSNDVPSSEFANSLRATVTTADTSLAAGENATIQQIVEGYNARDLIGRTFTLSFWVRSSKTGKHCISFTNSTPDRSYVIEYTVNTVNTWEKKSVTLQGGLVTDGTWDWTNGAGLRVYWSLAAGSNYQATANSWNTGYFIGTANQVNCLDTIGNIFAITGLQLEIGDAATPFEHRHYGLELVLCQRYYQLVTVSDLAQAAAGSAYSGSTVPLPVEMRATPTVTKISNGTQYNITAGGFVAHAKNHIRWWMLAAAAGVFEVQNTTASAYAEL